VSPSRRRRPAESGSGPARPGGVRSVLLLIVAVGVVASVLRGPIVAVAPVVAVIRDDLLLTAAQSGVFTSIPVLCFAVLTPVAVLVIARLGPDAAVTASILGVAAGIVVRSSGGVGWMIAGTVVIGAAITIGNVVVPVVIRRDVPADRVGLVTGIYSASLNIGTTITSLATAPIAAVSGWRIGLAFWVVFPVAALVCWVLAVGLRRASSRRPAERMRADRATDRRARAVPTGEVPTEEVPEGRSAEGRSLEAESATATAGRPGSAAAAPSASAPRVWRNLSVLLLAAAFAGQAFSYYGVTSWLPTILVDENGYTLAQGGAAASVFQIAAVAGALGVPVLLARKGSVRTVLVVAALWATVPAGLILAPSLWPLWCLLGGAAQGGGFTAIFVVVLTLAAGDAHASRLSAMVQGLGYAAGATAPTVVGYAHDVSGGWTVPLLLVLLAVSVFGVLGATSARRVRGGIR
jgi:CP family cyanate transporter-like MFS transporter